jgi:hypothetical protein
MSGLRLFILITKGNLMRRKGLPLMKSVAVAALAVIAASLALTSPASASPSGQAHHQQVTVASGVVHPASSSAPALAWKSFTSNGDTHAGDCTLFGGATWTLYSDGTFSFDGTVTSSDDNDAWLMYVTTFDGNNSQIGLVNNNTPTTPDPTEFVQSLGDHNLQYRWLASGNFPASWFNLIQSISVRNHC